MIFVCPKCMQKLNIVDGGAVCAEGHRYDRSKYGYYNLLLASSGGTHGDNAEMVAARREFLSRGYFDGVDLAFMVHTSSGFACAQGAVGIMMPKLEKSRLFDVVAKGGVLPKKTFSMGEAHEKRYYLEARRIVK